MKTAVIYKSKTGFTQKYAEWISQELGADLFPIENFDKYFIDNYDTIIYGGGLYAAGINGIKFIRLRSKKLIVFATGSSPWRESAFSKVKNKNFTPEEQAHLKFFYFRGGLDMTKMGMFDRFLMKLLKASIMSKGKKREFTPDEKGMLSAMENPVDFTSKDNIKDLIAYVREYNL
jgi:menaquinone-dependent protoporphyrinogen IX oxidase